MHTCRREDGCAVVDNAIDTAQLLTRHHAHRDEERLAVDCSGQETKYARNRTIRRVIVRGIAQQRLFIAGALLPAATPETPFSPARRKRIKFPSYIFSFFFFKNT